MSEIKTEYEAKLEEIEQALRQIENIGEDILKMKEFHTVLVKIELSEIYNMKDFMIKHLKPITRDITNININQITIDDQTFLYILQDLITSIV